MVIVENGTPNESQGQEWENPQDPKKPTDERDEEQVLRQYDEAKRRKDNLTETDHIDKEKKQDSQ
jgi:hypothetical protein